MKTDERSEKFIVLKPLAEARVVIDTDPPAGSPLPLFGLGGGYYLVTEPIRVRAEFRDGGDNA